MAGSNELTHEFVEKSGIKSLHLPLGIPPGSIDDEFLAFEAELPGFGGMYIDETGDLVIQHKLSSGNQPSVSAAYETLRETRYFKTFFRDPSAESRIRIRHVQYDIAELIEWKSRVSMYIQDEAILSVDADERRNRVVVGLENLDAAPRVYAAISTERIPSEAIVMEESERIVLYNTVQDRFRPMRGGLEIEYGSGGICTMTVVARHSSAEIGYGLVTAGHCSGGLGSFSGTTYSQDAEDTEVVATGLYNPSFFIGGDCPSGHSCRYSDAVFAEFNEDQFYEIDYGGIVRTEGGPTPWGHYGDQDSLTLASNYFTVDDHAGAGVGVEVHKIGRSSGWSVGEVKSTCKDFDWDYTLDQKLLCQDEASVLYATGGDSGSPVFTWSGPGSSFVDLVGVLSGGNPSTGNRVYSPWNGVLLDISGLVVQDD